MTIYACDRCKTEIPVTSTYHSEITSVALYRGLKLPDEVPWQCRAEAVELCAACAGALRVWLGVTPPEKG